MNYQEAYKRFDAAKFIDGLRGMEYLDILSALDREITSADSIHVSFKAKDRDVAYIQRKYINALKGLIFLIGVGGIKPAGINSETLNLYQPLISELVNKGVFEPGILNQLK